MRLFTCTDYRVTHVILHSPQRNSGTRQAHITLPLLATWIQLSGGVNRAMGELVDPWHFIVRTLNHKITIYLKSFLTLLPL